MPSSKHNVKTTMSPHSVVRKRGPAGMDSQTSSIPDPNGSFLYQTYHHTLALQTYSDMCSVESKGPLGLTPATLDPSSEPRIIRPLNFIFLDTEHLAGFIHSVADAQVRQYHTQLHWQEYNDSSIINLIYAVMPWKGRPGTVEIDIGTKQEVDLDIEKKNSHYQEVALSKLDEGPEEFARYLATLDKIRQNSLEALNQTYSDARSLNQQIVQTARNSIRTMATIKLASDVTIAVLAPTWLDIGYSITTATIKDASDGKKIDAILFTDAKKATRSAINGLMGNTAAQWGEKAKDTASDLQKIETKIAHRQKKLQKKLRYRKKGAHTIRKKIRYLKDDASFAQKDMNASLRKQKIFKAFKVAFIANDILDATTEFWDTWSKSTD